MLRGTRILRGKDAMRFNNCINTLRNVVDDAGFEEIILPSIWGTGTFTKKLGAEKERQIFTFPDKKGRDCCLIPEVTGLVQEMWNEGVFNADKLPLKLFYVSRCYRYERPQAGRYREFTQFGVEILGGDPAENADEAKQLLKECLSKLRGDFEFVDAVKRGLSYYVEEGFEVECPALGAQKQVAGGGRYAEGVGWAAGIERLVLASQ